MARVVVARSESTSAADYVLTERGMDVIALLCRVCAVFVNDSYTKYTLIPPRPALEFPSVTNPNRTLDVF